MDDSIEYHPSLAARRAAERAAELRERRDTLATGSPVSEKDAEQAELKAEAAHDRARRAATAAADSLEKSALLHERVTKVMEGAGGWNNHHPNEDHKEAARHREEARIDRQFAAKKRLEAASE
jgi:hypothetical protein